MKKWTLSDDPHANREAQKYDNPAPSREYLLAALEAYGKPITAFTCWAAQQAHPLPATPYWSDEARAPLSEWHGAPADPDSGESVR